MTPLVSTWCRSRTEITSEIHDAAAAITHAGPGRRAKRGEKRRDKRHDHLQDGQVILHQRLLSRSKISSSSMVP